MTQSTAVRIQVGFHGTYESSAVAFDYALHMSLPALRAYLREAAPEFPGVYSLRKFELAAIVAECLTPSL